MTQVIEATAKWRAGHQEHRGGVVQMFEGEVYGWTNKLRDPASNAHAHTP